MQLETKLNLRNKTMKLPLGTLGENGKKNRGARNRRICRAKRSGQDRARGLIPGACSQAIGTLQVQLI